NKFLKRLALLPGSIPPTRALVQIKEYPDAFLVRADLAAAFEKAGLTGFELVEPKKFITT
ncbi:MAG: hypothetical protein M3154_12180, partial [Candidatus Eremiobacteraeota bacterium]|nr:hypothetical protein [Candidatus Eremiobacteraeota bacterium]